MIRRHRIAAVLVLAGLDAALAGCASTAAPPMSDPMPPALAQCHADAAQSLVGQPASAQNVELARKRTGAAITRVIRPGQMVTMDFREDRLDIRVDTANVILRISCG